VADAISTGGETQPIILAHIEEAARVVDPVFLGSPQFLSEALSEATGARVIVKLETANPIRSFKGRGADFLLHSRPGSAGKALVCASAGNFGQAMAYVARKRGLALHVFAATTANPLKIERIRELGAEVHLYGRDYDDATARAAEMARELSGDLVIDGVEPAITEGAGTIGLELDGLDQAFDDVVVPVGGGALIGGVGQYLKAKRPAVRVVGVCATGAPAMADAWRTGLPEPSEGVDTIADGIAIRVPLAEAVACMRSCVDEMLLVQDDAMRKAMALALVALGVVIEPAGAAGLAGVIANRQRFAGRTVVVPLCGGNVAPPEMERLLAEAAHQVVEPGKGTT
jgi:threonine dehydratase